MAKARALDKRRKSIRNIRKITRTMELIATARFKKAMDRAHAATAYTRRITQLVADLATSGLEVKHPLLEGREKTSRAVLLVLTANRGLCGGYNSNVQRAGFHRGAVARWTELLLGRGHVPAALRVAWRVCESHAAVGHQWRWFRRGRSARAPCRAPGSRSRRNPAPRAA